MAGLRLKNQLTTGNELTLPDNAATNRQRADDQWHRTLDQVNEIQEASS